MPASAATPRPAPPRHQLDIAFDLHSHRLIGTSRIIIPAQTPVTISLANLEIMQFDLDGVTLQTAEQVVLPPALQDQHVAIRFHTTYAGNQADTLNGLIDPSGIALTGLWHPRLDT
ncbi:MAG: hypothetical protein ACYC0O_13165, partial [Desulfurivibrionaceae bacterium]